MHPTGRATESESERRFNALFERHHRDVFSYCARRLGRDDAEDATADVYSVAWRRLEQIPPGDAERLWLIGVAYKVVGNQYRAHQRRSRLSSRLGAMRSTAAETEEFVVRDPEEEALIRALAGLGERDREVLRLSAWDGLSNTEIATVMGVSDNAVAQRLFRARARLRNQYEKRYGRPPATEPKEVST
jgi:RNA polymerase sigma-70 factor (ECF subfamily)